MAVVKGSGKKRPPLPAFSINELRWEFLRRNKDYQKEFDNLPSLKANEFEAALSQLIAKWALTKALDWRDSLPKNAYIDVDRPRVLHIVDRYPSLEIAEGFFARAIRRVRAETESDSRGFLMMLFDLNDGLPSKGELWQMAQKYSAFSKRRKSKPKRTNAELNRSLWMLQMSELGMSDTEIAKVIYPKSDNPSDRRSDVKAQIKTAKSYIEMAPYLPIHS